MCGSALSAVVTGLALLLTLAALSMYHGYGFVQYDRLEDVQAALDGEKGRLYKGYRLGKETAPRSPDPSMRSRERVLLFESPPQRSQCDTCLALVSINLNRIYSPPEFLLCASPCCLGLTLNFYVLVFGNLC